MMHRPLGLILAGGQGLRMGGVPKADLRLGGQRLLDRCIARLEPQVDGLVVNANVAVETHLPVVPDTLPGHLGPLAGVLSGMVHGELLGHSHVVSVAVDTPFFPCDLVPCLQLAGLNHVQGLAVAATPDGQQGTFAIWPVVLKAALEAFLREGHRKVRAFTSQHGAQNAVFPATKPDAFFNINTPADLEAAGGWV